MKHAFTYCRCRGARVVIGNDSTEVTIDRAEGRLAELTVKQNGFGRWNQVPAYLQIVDELTEAKFQDGRNRAQVGVEVTRDEGQPAVRVTKAFRGAEFTVVETWTPTPTEVLWDVQVMLKRGKPARSIQVRQFIPWPDQPYGWKLWTAQQHYPKLTAQAGNHRIVYGDVCFGTVVPIATVYHEGKGVGLSLAKPFGLKIPQWGFEFGTYHFGGLHVESTLLGLRPNRPAHVALMLRGHAGCWRPGLGWLVDKYPEYFRPGNPKTPAIVEGGFMGGSPFSTDKDCRNALQAGAKVVEVHCHFPHYGSYCPTESNWKTIQWLEEPESARKKNLPENSVARMRDCMAMFRRHGIASLPYIQVAGDGWRPWVEKHFPESIALSRDGQKLPVWKDCWMMNSDPALPFGKHIAAEVERFFELYGDVADGLFWDQPCYDAIDIAHDDGITMVDNRPAYRLVYCYEQHAERMREEIRKRNLFLYANGPVYIELCRGMDAIMAEGVSWTADVDQYMCAARPMCFYSYFGPKDAGKLEEMFQKCLLLGGTCYSAHAMELSRTMRKLYAIYRPMIDRMRGRTFCFDPDPLSVPPSLEGNVFRGPDGTVFVPLLTRRLRVLDGGGPAKNVTVELRLPDAARFRRAVSMGTTHAGERPVRIERDGQRLTLTVRQHLAATLICLSGRR
ncbi:MAG: hypothetical protein A3K18_22340 [Lentisphaerae bacterium RIFOXYA12_64_32]|nr:MAG: hypothetical protein A3K18_22340 [Lentisphaerae bacterium RIFOXYA12_64_32]